MILRTLPLLLLASPLAFSQQPLTLEEAVRTALSTHPRVGSARAAIDSAKALEIQARKTFNPRLNLQLENLRIPRSEPYVFGRDTDAFAFLQQTLETANKRGLRGDVAAQQIRQNELDLSILERGIRLGVAEAWWRALGAQRAREILRETMTTFDQTVAYHRARVQEGAMAEADLIRVQVEAARFSLAANEADLEAAQARIELFRQMGQTTFPEVTLQGSLTPPSDGDFPPMPTTQQRPEILLARAQMDQANAQVRLETANAKPNVDVVGGYKRTNGFDTALAGVQVDLPVRNRNEGNIAAASAEVRGAQANLAAAEALVEAEVRAAKTEYETRRTQASQLFPKLRQQAEETARIARSAYQLGGAELLRLLDAERLRLEIELLYTQALADYSRSVARYRFALGEQP